MFIYHTTEFTFPLPSLSGYSPLKRGSWCDTGPYVNRIILWYIMSVGLYHGILWTIALSTLLWEIWCLSYVLKNLIFTWTFPGEGRELGGEGRATETSELYSACNILCLKWREKRSPFEGVKCHLGWRAVWSVKSEGSFIGVEESDSVLLSQTKLEIVGKDIKRLSDEAQV